MKTLGYSLIWQDYYFLPPHTIFNTADSFSRNINLGVEALGDLRKHNRGASPKLDDLQQAKLLQALRGNAPDGGLWNGRKVADYLSELLGVRIGKQQGWEYLKQMEYRLRVPRPQHQQADLEVQEY